MAEIVEATELASRFKGMGEVVDVVVAVVIIIDVGRVLLVVGTSDCWTVVTSGTESIIIAGFDNDKGSVAGTKLILPVVAIVVQ